MPLRSVEAATREDAIAAAREQFGPAARVVGVRRVRSGGVLGFFATERYVAEVAPDPVGAPGLPVPTPARPAGALTEDPDTGSLAAYGSPLAAAAPARARTAPARNGAAAYAAAAAPAVTATPALVGASSAGGRGADAGRPVAEPADDARVDELAGLLGAAPMSFPRATRPDPAPAFVADADASGAPSPFTAALARMVAGDRDVQHAVREALETSDVPRSAGLQDDREPQFGAATPDQSAVWSPATHQEEETVGDQVIAPPSTSVDEWTEFAAWADEHAYPLEVDGAASAHEAVLHEPAAFEPSADESPVSREEAIAEVLRTALAEGHSDDALAGILRKVVAGDPPETALATPAVATATPAPVELLDLPVPDVESFPAEPTVAESPFAELPVAESPAAEPPVAESPAAAPPAAVPFDLFAPVTPTVEVPAGAAAGSTAPVHLWGEVSPAAAPAVPAVEPVAPAPFSIWGEVGPAAEVVPVEVAPVEVAPVEAVPLVETSLFDAPLFDAPLFDAPLVESPAIEAEPVAVEEPVLAGTGEEQPVLARTASDPAPVIGSMSMDATTVMPPLSLLPGSPSRGRGLPPVPPRTGRPPVPPSQTRATSAPSAGAPVAGSSSGTRTPAPLATVTRLPVAPLMATPETPDLSGLADLLETGGPGVLDALDLPAAVPARPSRVRIPPPTTTAEVVSRLADLGVPADLLGSSFTAAVEADGTYAALTRALGDRLPEAPELPTGAGDVLFVVGPGAETLRTARSLAATLRLDPERVQWASRGDLVGLAPETSRMSTIGTALRRRQDAASSGTVTIVAVDAPLRADAYWMAQMLAIWSPVAVWAVVEATRKPEDLEHWIDGLTRVDALVVQDTDLSADPAAVLHRLSAPVAVVDGARATPHRWASMLCERLESAPA